ncbi:hypothetical protein NMY22_g2611 [Coprinellus aureogranulatus]|nr:hypothetical protein NMY22_g2611 [Coprinellus aureogranulatus]
MTIVACSAALGLVSLDETSHGSDFSGFPSRYRGRSLELGRLPGLVAQNDYAASALGLHLRRRWSIQDLSHVPSRVPNCERMRDVPLMTMGTHREADMGVLRFGTGSVGCESDLSIGNTFFVLNLCFNAYDLLRDWSLVSAYSGRQTFVFYVDAPIRRIPSVTFNIGAQLADTGYHRSVTPLACAEHIPERHSHYILDMGTCSS